MAHQIGLTGAMTVETYPDAVARQRDEIPGLYGDVDFTVVPERLDVDATAADDRFGRLRAATDRVFERPELLARMSEYTMTGDRVADAYAALIPQYGFRALVDMLDTACESGLDHVDDPPPQLVALIRSMERTPEWVDMDLVARGAREERVPMATATPFAIRGAFLATFLNKYAALPMTLTGTLSNEAARQRVFETASFFTATTLPGALDRHGKGFQAAAKVRLMHSMVRYHLLTSGSWDVDTYGIPIPQVDQMPAGTIGTFFLSMRVLEQGRTEFTDDERATVELARYRCFLLGLPEDLLGDSPQEIVDLLMARHVSLREGYDDEICGSLVRGTLGVELFDRSTVKGRLHSWLEDGFSRFVLVKSFLGGDTERATAIGIEFGRRHQAAAGCAIVALTANRAFYRVGLGLPVVSGWVDRRLNTKIAHLLDSYGHADFVTDPASYHIAVA